MVVNHVVHRTHVFLFSVKEVKMRFTEVVSSSAHEDPELILLITRLEEGHRYALHYPPII